MTPISIQLYTVREYVPSEGMDAVLERIARIGYDGVEPGDVGADPSAYRRKLANLGLRASSWFGPHPEPSNVNQMIETAKALEVENVVTGYWIPDWETPEAMAKMANELNAAIPAFSAAGLNLCMHNHWFEFDPLDGRPAILKLMEMCPGLKLEVDIYWASGFGANDVASFVRGHKADIPLLHVKDGPLVKGEPHTALGKGKMDIPPILAAADPSVLRWLVVELDECGTDMWTAVEESYMYLVGSGVAG